MKLNRLSLTILILMLIGVIFLASSSTTEALNTIGDKYFFIKKQLIWCLLGLVTYQIGSKIKMSFIFKHAAILYFIATALLIILFLPQFGISALGAKRWLDLGFIDIQPSEFFKICSLIYFAKVFSRPDGKSIIHLFIGLGLPIVFIILEPNLSTAILIIAAITSIYYLSGGEIIHLFGFTLICLLASSILIFSSPYRKARLDSGSYHAKQLILAISSGQLFGKGLANSDQKYSYLPKISTDSIFAVISEEFGLIGGVSLLIIYLSLITQIFAIGQKSNDTPSSLYIKGFGCLLAYQTIVNISATVGLIPLTGVPLPLISYGGSSLLTVLFGLGLVNNVYSTSHEQNNQNYRHNRHPPHSSHRTN